MVKQGNLLTGTHSFSLQSVSLKHDKIGTTRFVTGHGTYTTTAATPPHPPPPPPVTKTCDASISRSTVDFGTVQAHDIPTVGSAVGERSFELLFNDCKGYNQVRYRLAPTSWTATSNGIIPNATGAGHATGVGVQILEGSSGTAPVAFSNSGNGDSVPGYNPSCTGTCNYSIPLRARLVRTSNITQGTISAQMQMIVQYN